MRWNLVSKIVVLVPTDFILETTPDAEKVPVLRSAAHSTGWTLIELDQDDPVGERGRQERGDKTFVHGEEPARRDPWMSFQVSDHHLW